MQVSLLHTNKFFIFSQQIRIQEKGTLKRGSILIVLPTLFCLGGQGYRMIGCGQHSVYTKSLEFTDKYQLFLYIPKLSIINTTMTEMLMNVCFIN